MENQKNIKKTVIIISDCSENFIKIKQILEENFNPVIIDESSYSFEYISMKIKYFSALIIRSEKAAENNYKIFKQFSSDPLLLPVPIIVCCHDISDDSYAEKCLEYGAADIIYPPLNKKFIIYKIQSAMHLKNSATFYQIENMLKELPSNIYLKDSKGRYIFATHYWHHLEHPDDPEWTIRGKTDAEIRKDKANAQKAMEADKEILKTGKGTAYTIEINSDGQREFLEIIKRPLHDENGCISGIIGLINNVTERELLRISLEESAMMDELTCVYNRRFFEQYTASLEKSGKYPVSIISADCNDLKKVNDTYGHLVGDEYIRMTALLFRTNTTIQHKGRIFRTGGDEFVIILSETSLDEAENIIKKLQNEAVHFSVKQKNVSISYGASCLENKNTSFRECLDNADKQMYKNKSEYKRNQRNPL